MVATPAFAGHRTFTWFTPRRRAATEYELYTVGQQSSPEQWLNVGWPILMKTELLASNAPRHGYALTPLVLASAHAVTERHRAATAELVRLVLADPSTATATARCSPAGSTGGRGEHPGRRGAGLPCSAPGPTGQSAAACPGSWSASWTC